MDITGKLRLGAIVLAISALMAAPSFAQSEGGGEGGGGGGGSFLPQSGWWTNPAEPGGRGFIIEVNGSGEIYASALAYEDQHAAWYVINTQPVNGGQVGGVQRFVGGQSMNGDYRENAFVTFVDTASFSFQSPTAGTLTLSSGAIPIQRYDIVANGVASGPAAGAPRGGWWWAPSESGSGYFLEAQRDSMFFAALMYDDLGQPTWYSARGPMTTPTFFSAELTLTYGGQTLDGSYQQPVQMTDVGPMTLQFATDSSATLTLPGGRQVALVRYGF